MQRAMTSVGLIASTLTFASHARAQRFEYLPGTSQYRLSVQSTGYAEQGGSRQEVSYDTQQRMTLVLAKRSPDTLGLSITLDSITGRLPTGAAINGSGMLGIKLQAAVSPLGRLYAREAVTGPGVDLLGDFANELVRFLPALPPTIGVGVSWSDTVATPITQMGTQLNRSIVTTYRVAADTTVDGQAAWRIERSAKETVSGSGNAMGQQIRFETEGSGSGQFYVSHSGQYLGADYKDDLVSKATLAPQGIAITNAQTQLTRIALVR